MRKHKKNKTILTENLLRQILKFTLRDQSTTRQHNCLYLISYFSLQPHGRLHNTHKISQFHIIVTAIFASTSSSLIKLIKNKKTSRENEHFLLCAIVSCYKTTNRLENSSSSHDVFRECPDFVRVCVCASKYCCISPSFSHIIIMTTINIQRYFHTLHTYI